VCRQRRRVCSRERLRARWSTSRSRRDPVGQRRCDRLRRQLRLRAVGGSGARGRLLSWGGRRADHETVSVCRRAPPSPLKAPHNIAFTLKRAGTPRTAGLFGGQPWSSTNAGRRLASHSCSTSTAWHPPDWACGTSSLRACTPSLPLRENAVSSRRAVDRGGVVRQILIMIHRHRQAEPGDDLDQDPGIGKTNLR
jgi:hypothetical protein